MVPLADIRGYDGIDPARLMDLLSPLSTNSIKFPYALTQWLTPSVEVLRGGGCALAPILSMLNVRYVIFRGTPIALLIDKRFSPSQVAYVEAPVKLPENCRGDVAIVEENPTRLTVSLNMQTPGLVVLADAWDSGWHAYLNGSEVPVLRANHAVRGVQVPAGTGTLQFRFEPAGFYLGLKMAFVAILVCCGWLLAAVRTTRRTTAVEPSE
jgi:hypothetical protein